MGEEAQRQREIEEAQPITKRQMRQFDTGATRDSADDKYDYEGFLSPEVLEMFASYMHKHRHQADGNLRDSDNWQKGIPREAYMKSLWRHFMDVWKQHRGLPGQDELEESLTAMMFNVMGYLFEVIKEKKKAASEPERESSLTTLQRTKTTNDNW